MNREEVIELMNRELDGDLSQEERGLLFQHLATCPDSQAMFEKLKSLSVRLEALPKVKPAFSIVDRILPTLDEIDQIDRENVNEDRPSKTGTRFTLKNINFKKLWVPGSVIAAGLLITFMINAQQMNNYSDIAEDHSGKEMSITRATEEAGGGPEGDNADSSSQMNTFTITTPNDVDHDEARHGTENYAGTQSSPEQPDKGKLGSENNEKTSGTESKSETDQSDKPIENNGTGSSPESSSENVITNSTTNSTVGKQGDNTMSMTDAPEEEEAFYESPDGIYSAKIGSGDEDIMIDKEGRPYFLTSQSHWDRSWALETIEWISNVELYYVIYHAEKNERQYWLINAEERKETQLDEPINEKEKE